MAAASSSSSSVDTLSKGKRRKKRNRPKEPTSEGGIDANVIKLPGGYAYKSVMDEVPDAVAYRVRAYLDELFGTIMLQVKESNDCFDAMPIVVSNILKYNNVQFATVDMYKTNVNIPEPLWFKYRLDKRHLILYLNECMYNDYCTTTTSTDVPVVWSCGHVPVDKYNPYRAHPDVSELDPAKIKCAMVCDHVAQHIIHRYYNDAPLLASADLHERGWTRCGTTLHSMLDIEIVENPCGERNVGTANRVLTMLPRQHRSGGGGVSLGLISSREYAL